MKCSFKKATTIASLLITSIGAEAGVISIKTGWNEANNSSLSAGQLDYNWQISNYWSGPGSNFAFETAKTLYDFEKYQNMRSVKPTANWIGTQFTSGDGRSDWNQGYYNHAVARTQFNLDLSGKNVASFGITATFRVADQLQDIFINGNRIGGAGAGGYDIDNYTGGYSWDRDFQLDSSSSTYMFGSLLKNGVNTLEISGRSINSQWDGFYFDGAISFEDLMPDESANDGVVSVSAPDTFTLLGLGLFGLGLARRKA